MRPGFHSVTPYLIARDASAAIEFYKQAFHATELMRVPAPGGQLMHSELQIGDSQIMMADEHPDMGYLSPLSLGKSPVGFMLYVEDADAAYHPARPLGRRGGSVQLPLVRPHVQRITLPPFVARALVRATKQALFRLVHHHRARFHDPADILDRGVDIVERIPFDSGNIGEIAGLQPPQPIADSQQLGVMPALTNQASSRVFSPNMVYNASDPMANRTPARNAFFAVSRLRAMKS